MELAFEILHSSDWMDDDRDHNRTMANMEMAAIRYIQEFLPRMENWPIYVQDEKNPTCLIGIEQVFDVVVTYDDNREIRYIGTIDGLVYKLATKTWYLDENKTSIRLDDGWRNSFDLAHQITGYCAASTSVFGFPVMRNRVFGVPVKVSGKGDGIAILEPLGRTGDSIQHWGHWLRDTVETYERYENDWENAPLYTHSCNRYFRPCSLLAFCADTPDGRRESWRSEMVDASRSPSERGAE